MRVLAACPACRRQFDASSREAGEHFHCSCGEVLTVPPGRGHDASVVRCSSCGAPRQEGALACSFCGSDFTLHERDLHTLCPGCFARVSDRARFCHHCATPIVPQGTAGEETERVCPACGDGRRLVSRELSEEAVAVFECGACAGLWLGQEVFALLEERARLRMTAELVPGERPAAALQKGPLYRPCVVCGVLMHRRNYGKKSGVIVDLCQQHGIWLDAGELDQILAWIRRGGPVRAAAAAAEEARVAEQRARLASWGGGLPPDLTSSSPASLGSEGGLITAVVAGLASLFER